MGNNHYKWAIFASMFGKHPGGSFQDPMARISPYDALAHPWLKEDGESLAPPTQGGTGLGSSCPEKSWLHQENLWEIP